ncbi:MAG: YqgE/AlgH family protein [Gemmataceae bacterium]|nr:YqgE/AlgH family protein [Gemmataceae bacterium]MDW8267284.1 YqgE/AlgH family protein [Gemmataceae bacterium]
MPFYAGSFLVARPTLQDPSFRQTVVLLLEHNAEGAFGLVVNRPRPVEGIPFPVYYGGPCQSDGLLMLHAHPEWLPQGESEKRQVAPGIYMGDASCLERVSGSDSSELRFRMFAGYAGWGPGQLERELALGAWVIVPAHAERLFGLAADEMWELLVPWRFPQPSVN